MAERRAQPRRRDRHRARLHAGRCRSRLNARFAGVDTPDDAARRCCAESCSGAPRSSRRFGAESAVLLAPGRQRRSVDPGDLPRHAASIFPRRWPIAIALIERLGLTDVRIVRPDPERCSRQRTRPGCAGPTIPTAAARSARSSRWPRALAGFDTWIIGPQGVPVGHARQRCRASRSTPTRSAGSRSIRSPTGPRPISTPISRRMICRAIRSRREGYPSIGCSPCTSKVLPGEDPRSGRWRGWDKVECGIHTPADGPDQPSF